jgi:hypothetical protein
MITLIVVLSSNTKLLSPKLYYLVFSCLPPESIRINESKIANAREYVILLLLTIDVIDVAILWSFCIDIISLGTVIIKIRALSCRISWRFRFQVSQLVSCIICSLGLSDVYGPVFFSATIPWGRDRLVGIRTWWPRNPLSIPSMDEWLSFLRSL